MRFRKMDSSISELQGDAKKLAFINGGVVTKVQASKCQDRTKEE